MVIFLLGCRDVNPHEIENTVIEVGDNRFTFFNDILSNSLRFNTFRSINWGDRAIFVSYRNIISGLSCHNCVCCIYQWESGVSVCFVNIIIATLSSISVLLALRHLDGMVCCLAVAYCRAFSLSDFAGCPNVGLTQYFQLCLFRMTMEVCLCNLDLPRLTPYDADPEGCVHVLRGVTELVLNSEGARRG